MMSNQKTVLTEKGTALPLLNLKGKSYLMVAHRLQWLSEKYANYRIETNFLVMTDEQTVARSTVTIFDAEGRLIRQASASKRETKRDFPDHLEKAESSATGRALAMLGLGTQHALSDLDEGDRIVDSPVVQTVAVQAASSAEASSTQNVVTITNSVSSEAEAAPAKKTSPFKKKVATTNTSNETQSSSKLDWE
jgi:hypothetical protein